MLSLSKHQIHEEESRQTRLPTRPVCPVLSVTGADEKRRPRMRTPALRLIACVNSGDFSHRAGNSARISVKCESDDDLNRARDDLVSGNALLVAF